MSLGTPHRPKAVRFSTASCKPGTCERTSRVNSVSSHPGRMTLAWTVSLAQAAIATRDNCDLTREAEQIHGDPPRLSPPHLCNAAIGQTAQKPRRSLRPSNLGIVIAFFVRVGVGDSIRELRARGCTAHRSRLTESPYTTLTPWAIWPKTYEGGPDEIVVAPNGASRYVAAFDKGCAAPALNANKRRSRAAGMVGFVQSQKKKRRRAVEG